MPILINDIRLLARVIIRVMVPIKIFLRFISIYLPDSFALTFESSFAPSPSVSSLAPGSRRISCVLGALAGWMSNFSAVVELSLGSLALALVGLRALSR